MAALLFCSCNIDIGTNSEIGTNPIEEFTNNPINPRNFNHDSIGVLHNYMVVEAINAINQSVDSIEALNDAFYNHFGTHLNFGDVVLSGTLMDSLNYVYSLTSVTTEQFLIYISNWTNKIIDSLYGWSHISASTAQRLHNVISFLQSSEIESAKSSFALAIIGSNGMEEEFVVAASAIMDKSYELWNDPINYPEGSFGIVIADLGGALGGLWAWGIDVLIKEEWDRGYDTNEALSAMGYAAGWASTFGRRFRGK